MSAPEPGDWDPRSDPEWESGFDATPETHLDDADYDAFVRSNFGADGSAKHGPPLGIIALVVGLVFLVVAVLMLT